MINRQQLFVAGFCFLVVFNIRFTDCKHLHNGTFHFYPKSSQKHYLIIRHGSSQKEVEVGTGDTIYWKVSWLNDCTSTADYISGGMFKTEQEKNFLVSHKLIVEILDVASDHYLIRGNLDSLNSPHQLTDTIWMKAK